MAFTVTFPVSGDPPQSEAVHSWLTEQGEPFEADNPRCAALRALPVRILIEADAPMRAQIEVTETVPLDRLINLLFELSVNCGSDVRLAGVGAVTRADLWLRLADEQDRVRMGHALGRATERGNTEVFKRLWAVLSSISTGRDLRWDARAARIVRLEEVGVPGGISAEEASFLADSPAVGDLVAVPVEGNLHILAWRWLSEAHPGLAEP